MYSLSSNEISPDGRDDKSRELTIITNVLPNEMKEFYIKTESLHSQRHYYRYAELVSAFLKTLKQVQGEVQRLSKCIPNIVDVISTKRSGGEI